MHVPLPKDHERSHYSSESPWSVRSKHSISILTWLLVVTGFIITYKHNPYYLFLFGPFVFFVLIYLSLSNIIGCLYKPFPYKKHREKVMAFWQSHEKPSVDIFLPICGEPLQVLRNTWQGVAEMAKHYGSAMRVIVLDDKGNTQAKQLALSYGFSYGSRPNKGEMKKAGNLKFGYENSAGDFVMILDADFRPQPDMVDEMLPYMADGNVAIVQSPQYFELEGLTGLQYGAGNIQRHFYRTVQRSRGSIDGSICVGSCALYRREALDQVGGTYQIEHSEDVWTGYSLISKGWKIQYIPVPLSKGLCPDDLHSFFKQQNRWCNGSLSLLTSNLFWKSNVAWKTKLSYISGFMFYLSNPLLLLFPIQNFTMLYDKSPVEWYVGFFFLPSVTFTAIFMWRHVYGDVKYGTVLAYMTALWSYSYAIFASLTHTQERWTPTGGSQTFSIGFKRMVGAATVYYIAYCASILYSLVSGQFDFFNWHYSLTAFWILVNFSFQSVFMHGVWSYILAKREETRMVASPAL